MTDIKLIKNGLSALIKLDQKTGISNFAKGICLKISVDSVEFRTEPKKLPEFICLHKIKLILLRAKKIFNI